MVEVVYKFDEKVLPRMLEKVNLSLKYNSNFFWVHKHIYKHIYIYIYMYSILHILTIVFPDKHNVKYQPIFHGSYSMA